MYKSGGGGGESDVDDIEMMKRGGGEPNAVMFPESAVDDAYGDGEDSVDELQSAKAPTFTRLGKRG